LELELHVKREALPHEENMARQWRNRGCVCASD